VQAHREAEPRVGRNARGTRAGKPLAAEDATRFAAHAPARFTGSTGRWLCLRERRGGSASQQQYRGRDPPTPYGSGRQAPETARHAGTRVEIEHPLTLHYLVCRRQLRAASCTALLPSPQFACASPEICDCRGSSSYSPCSRWSRRQSRRSRTRGVWIDAKWWCTSNRSRARRAWWCTTISACSAPSRRHHPARRQRHRRPCTRASVERRYRQPACTRGPDPCCGRLPRAHLL
jgi:hypothetical protein